jgi:Holliday junction resolvase RusA-like endonuclease
VAETIELELPMPPGVNNLYFNKPGVGRLKTHRYRRWRADAVRLGALQSPGRIVGCADVTIHLMAAKGDTDAYAKPLIDAAKQIGIIADDGKRYVRHLTSLRTDRPDAVWMVFARVDETAGTSA